MKRVLLYSLILAMAGLPAEAQMSKAPIYRPPTPNAPKVRVDGRLRGPNDAVLTLTVLAPEHVGLTRQAQPRLYWYQSRAHQTRFELVITEPKAAQPLLEVKFEQKAVDGIQRLNLADHGVTLTPGVDYKWSVAMVSDEENRSSDVVASGGIRRITPPESLQKRVANAPATELPFIYADEGFWYDSLDALCQLIEKEPTQKQLFEQRSVFFMQVGLRDAAMFDLRQAGQSVAAPAPPTASPKTPKRK